MSKHQVITAFSTHTLRAAAAAGVLAILTACAPAPTARTTPAPIDNLSAPPAPKASLSLVQVCAPNGRKCELAFVQIKQGADAAAMVRDYFKRSTGAAIPAVSVETSCSTGWAAAVESEQGSVRGGGVMHAQAAVCGYPTAESALNKALDICDAKTSGGCRKSNRIKADWGRWDSATVNGQNLDTGRPEKAWSFAGGQMCDSTVPIVVSGSCPAEPAAMLRAAGVKFP